MKYFNHYPRKFNKTGVYSEKEILSKFIPLYDYRKLDLLEIIIFTYNEEERIHNLLVKYSSLYNVVLIDAGSIDDTHQICKKYKASCFVREDPYPLVEQYIAAYINNLSLSGRCIYMSASELYSLSDVNKADIYLQKYQGVVYVNRVDYLYGIKLKNNGGIIPRGFFKGSVIFNPQKSIHGSLHACQNTLNYPYFLIDVHHFALWDIQRDFGKVGDYTVREVDIILNSSHWKWIFFKRFFLRINKFVFTRFWKESNWKIRWFCILMYLVEIPIALMYLCENKWFLNRKEQLDLYENKYKIDD